MLRQALFNSVQGRVEGARVLDLFAGSGALGFEALSRGAAHVVFLESDAAAIRCIQKNIQTLGVGDRAVLLAEPLLRSHSHLKKRGPFDLILADPPYGKEFEGPILTLITEHELLATDGTLCLEWGGKETVLPDTGPFLVKIREKNYGDSILTTFRRP